MIQSYGKGGHYFMSMIGIDIGSTGIKCALFRDGKEIIKKAASTPAKRDLEEPGRFEIDPCSIAQTVRDILDDTIREGGAPSSIWIDTMMHGCVVCDEKGDPVTDYISWQDTYGAPCLEEVKGLLGEDLTVLGTRYKAGLSLVSLYARGDSIPKECFIYTLGDFVISRISDGDDLHFATHPTMAASLGFFNVKDGTWDRERISAVFPGKIMVLPEIAAEGTRLGTYNGIPIYGDVGDHQAGILGTSEENDDTVFITLGTGGIISKPVRQKVFGDFETRPYFDGRYILTKTGQMGGRDLDSIVSLYAGILREFVKDIRLSNLWDTLLEGDLKVTDLLVDPDIHENTGTITGIRTDNFTYSTLFDSALIGIARGLMRTVEKMGEGMEFSSIMINGGTLAHSRKVMQAFRSVTDKTIGVSDRKDEALLGLYRLETGRKSR